MTGSMSQLTHVMQSVGLRHRLGGTVDYGTMDELAARNCPENWGFVRRYNGYAQRQDLTADMIETLAGPGIDDDGRDLPSSYPRLREGVERFLITDINNPAAAATAQSDIVVMFDSWGFRREGGSYMGVDVDSGQLRFNHIPGGSNVLYMDGHVSFVRLNEGIPIWQPTENEVAPGAHAIAASRWWVPHAGGFG